MRRTAPGPAVEQATYPASQVDSGAKIAAMASLASFLRCSIRDIELRLATDRQGLAEEIREANKAASNGEIPPGDPNHCTACEAYFYDGQRGADALTLIERRA